MFNNKILFYIFLVLTVTLDAFIIAESCIGGVGSASQSQGITQAVIEFVEAINPASKIGENPEQVHAVVRKVIGHFMLFGLSGILASLTLAFSVDSFDKHKIRIMIIGLSVGLFLALLTETIQYFIPGRAGLISDVLIDFSGYLFFGGITYLIFFLIYKNKTKKNNLMIS